MLKETEIAELQAQVRDVQEKLGVIQRLLLQKAQTENMLGDWISEKDAITLSGLGRTRLYQLRAAGKLTTSTLGGKAVWFRVSDFRQLLNENEKQR